MPTLQPGDVARDAMSPMEVTAVAMAWTCMAGFYVFGCFLFYHRNWPPLRSTNLSFLFVQIGSASCWLVGMMAWYGFPGMHDGVFRVCYGALINGLGMAVVVSVQVVRYWRFYRIFILHNTKMWPVTAQVSLLTLVLMPPHVGTSVAEQYVPAADMCTASPSGRAFVAMGLVACCMLASMVLAWQLRTAHGQFYEWRSALLSLVLCLILIISWVIFHTFVWPVHRELGRCGMLVFPVAATAAAVLPFYLRFAIRKLMNDKEFAQSYIDVDQDHAILDAPLAAQIADPRLRPLFEKFVAARYATELLSYYDAVMRRNAVTDYFDRVAHSMQILSTYIRVGAPEEINIDGNLRSGVLSSTNKIGCPKFFDAVTYEVLTILELDLQRQFKTTDEWRELEAELRGGRQALEDMRDAGLARRRSSQQSVRSAGSLSAGRKSSLSWRVRKTSSASVAPAMPDTKNKPG